GGAGPAGGRQGPTGRGSGEGESTRSGTGAVRETEATGSCGMADVPGADYAGASGMEVRGSRGGMAPPGVVPVEIAGLGIPLHLQPVQQKSFYPQGAHWLGSFRGVQPRWQTHR